MDTTKPFNILYTVTYTDKAGETHRTKLFWTEDGPTEQEVAIEILDRLLGKFQPITDKDPNDQEDTIVRQLRLAGLTNIKVERDELDDMCSAQAIEDIFRQDMESESVAEALIRQDQMNMAEQLMQDDAAVLRALAKK